jgi:hypothetical protein
MASTDIGNFARRAVTKQSFGNVSEVSIELILLNCENILCLIKYRYTASVYTYDLTAELVWLIFHRPK